MIIIVKEIMNPFKIFKDLCDANIVSFTFDIISYPNLNETICMTSIHKNVVMIKIKTFIKKLNLL